MPGSEREQLWERLRDKPYRDGLLQAEINNGLAFQIRALQRDRGWTQAELGEKVGVRQALISQWEDPNYGRYTLSSLRKLASAFDVALLVRFAPYRELADWIIERTQESLAPAGFN